jgi:hypothetical protein
MGGGPGRFSWLKVLTLRSILAATKSEPPKRVSSNV